MSFSLTLLIYLVNYLFNKGFGFSVWKSILKNK